MVIYGCGSFQFIFIAFGCFLLTLSQTSNFGLFQTERVCRWQFQIWWKWQKVIKMSRKHCGKRRNCLLQAISPFPTVFSNDLCCRHVKARVFFGKGLTLYHMIETFNNILVDNFWKHSRKRRKSWQPAFFFTHNFSFSIKDTNLHSSYYEFVICKCFKIGPF